MGFALTGAAIGVAWVAGSRGGGWIAAHIGVKQPDAAMGIKVATGVITFVIIGAVLR
jgi:hypothetical protein